MSQDADNLTHGVIDQETQAYFDGELLGKARDEFEAKRGQDGNHQRSIEELQCLREWIVEGIDVQARAVPEARFEQIWNQFDKVQSRETRLREAVQGKSWWQRVWSPIKPSRWMVWSAVAGGAVALAIVFLDVQGLSGLSNLASQTPADQIAKQSSVKGNEPPNAAVLPLPEQGQEGESQRSARLPLKGVDWKNSASKLVANDRVPLNNVVNVEAPEEAKIEQIEFGGNVGGHISRIESSRGTTTVIWITEDDTVVDGEREL